MASRMNRVAAGVCGAAAVLMAATVVSARRSRMSLQGRIITSVVLPCLRMKRRMRDDRALMRSIARNRSLGPALPPDGLRRRFVITEDMHDGMRVFTVAPREGASGARIVYLHGGAYVFDIVKPHWTLISGLAARSGATVVVPLYPLAPEHTLEDAFGPVTSLYESTIAEVGADRVILGGDSAGGGFALALAQQLLDRGCQMPAGLMLFSPWCDATGTDPRQVELSRRDQILDVRGGPLVGRRWAGRLPLDDIRISPLFGPMVGLPPTVVFAGTHDTVFSDAERLADRARENGVDLVLHRYDGMFHVWPALDFPEGRRALSQAAAFVRLVLS